MSLEGQYEPSTWDFVRDQVSRYEATGGREGGIHDGRPVVVLTTRGAKTGKLRKAVLIRVEHGGRYLAVGTMGGSPTHPAWYANIRAEPRVELQDGPVRTDMTARQLSGDEKDEWWARAVAVFPRYEEYRQALLGQRDIPVLLLEASAGATAD